MHKKLQEITDWAPFIIKMTGTDAAICVWNTDGVVEAYFKSKYIDLDFPIGFKADDDNELWSVIRTGRAIYNKVPKELFGVAFEGKILPVFDGPEIVGVVTYCVSTEMKDAILNNAALLTESIKKTEDTIDMIQQGIENLASNINEVQKVSDIVGEQVGDASEVIGQIQRNANYSNILALNASIESARAGQAGKGFAVVSNEMGKFSKMSSEAAKKIDTNLGNIVSSLSEVQLAVKNSNEIALEQVHSIHELKQICENVMGIAKHVVNVCNELNDLENK